MKRLAISACIAAISFATYASAQSSQDTDIAGCFTIQEDQKRLECYDALAKRSMRSAEEVALEKKEKNKRRFGLRRTEKPTKAEDFGITKPEPTEISEIPSQIVDITFVRDTAKRITLANGQVWEQLQSDDRNLKPSRIEKYKQEEITIKKASFGSYKMRIGKRNLSIRVRRVK